MNDNKVIVVNNEKTLASWEYKMSNREIDNKKEDVNPTKLFLNNSLAKK